MFQKVSVQNCSDDYFMFIWFGKKFLMPEEILSIQSNETSPCCIDVLSVRKMHQMRDIEFQQKSV